MNDPLTLPITLAVVMLGATAIAAVRKLSERRRTRRALHDKPALDPGLPEGTQVRATGTVRATDPLLEAPFSGRRCVAYRSRMHTTGGLIGAAFRPHEAVAVSAFTLERPDATSVRVTSEHALIVDLSPVPLGPETALRCEQFAIARAVASGDRRHARYEEVVIEDGMVVSVVGLLMKDPGDEPAPNTERGFRDDPPPKLRLAGNTDRPIVIGPASEA